MRKAVAPLTLIVALLITAATGTKLVDFGKANPYGEFRHISISSPQDEIYQNTTIPLLIYVYVPKWHSGVASIYYSIDGNSNHTLVVSQEIQEYISASGSLVNLAEGSHTLKAYTDTLDGKVLSTGCTFAVDTTFQHPQVTIVSPLNRTYSTNEVPLTYTINAKVLWAYYFLDNSPNMRTFSGNTTLTGLSEGPHKLSVSVLNEDYKYALDRYAQETIYFTIAKELEPQLDSFPTLPIAASIATVAIVSIGLLVYFKKRKRQTKPPFSRLTPCQSVV